MTDIVDRLRSPEVFIDMGGMTSRVAHEAAAEIERLREAVKTAADEIERLRAEIAMLRADLLKTEMKAELDDLENVGRLVAIGRREGIEAALPLLAASDEVLSGLARGECEQFMYAEFAPVVGAFRALLKENGR